MPRRDDLWLADIVESAHRIATWLADATDQRWDEDEILRNAVAYQIQIIGKAAAKLSDEVRGQIPDVPWRSIRGFRNIIVHQYFAVDWSTVRDTARIAVPQLASQIVGYLRSNNDDLLRSITAEDTSPPSPTP
jgi:uncharacterized protein with HEPN domain